MSEASRVYPLVAVAFVPSIRRSGGRACPLSPVAHEYLRDHQSARRRVHGVLSKRVADSSLEKRRSRTAVAAGTEALDSLCPQM